MHERLFETANGAPRAHFVKKQPEFWKSRSFANRQPPQPRLKAAQLDLEAKGVICREASKPLRLYRK